MSRPNPDEQEVFNTARRITDPAARAAYLRQACAGDDKLRQRVETLVLAHEAEPSFLEHPPSNRSPPPTATPTRVTAPPGHRPTARGKSALTSCSACSAKAGWGRSTWPSRSAPSAARSP